MIRAHVLGPALLWCVVALSGCDTHVNSGPHPSMVAPATTKPEASGASSYQSPLMSHDFGEVLLDDGSVRLEHDFVVSNPSEQALTIVKITTSCGCVKAEVEQSELGPGEVTTLRAAIDVAGVGRTEQSATIAFSDGSIAKYWLHAIGTRSLQLHVIPLRHRITRSSRSIRMTLQVVDRQGRLEQGAPTARIGGQALPVLFDKWMVIEARSEVTDRPLRQSTSIEVDLNPYSGSFPAVIDIAIPSGLAAKVTVDMPH